MVGLWSTLAPSFIETLTLLLTECASVMFFFQVTFFSGSLAAI